MGFGEKPALLLIDLYRGVFGDEPKPLLEAIKEWPGSCGMTAWDSVPHIQTLLQAARDAAIPVIPRHRHQRRHRRRGALGRPPRVPASPGHGARRAQERRSRRWEIIDEVTPSPAKPCCARPLPVPSMHPLAAHLNYLGVDTVIVCGESTSGCVRASVVGWLHLSLPCHRRGGVRLRPPRDRPRNEPLSDMNQKVRRCPLPRRCPWSNLAAWRGAQAGARSPDGKLRPPRDTAAVAKRPLLSRPATRDRRPLRNRHSRESGNPGGGAPRLGGVCFTLPTSPPTVKLRKGLRQQANGARMPVAGRLVLAALCLA